MLRKGFEPGQNIWPAREVAAELVSRRTESVDLML
jgi:hypothetical protein